MKGSPILAVAILRGLGLPVSAHCKGGLGMGQKKRVPGTVDRVEGDVAVVVIRDPDDPDSNREVYVSKKKLKKVNLKEGDKVTVTIDKKE
ncbi:MAG: hypothetical protein EOM25_13620 [Deltaproteobacteria bacterium]|nr:hypothetical protein [Deltaproteobacteria bacterium]